jgi:hypothetical protein
VNSKKSFDSIQKRTEGDEGGLKFSLNASRVNNKAALAAIEMGKPVCEQSLQTGESPA